MTGNAYGTDELDLTEEQLAARLDENPAFHAYDVVRGVQIHMKYGGKVNIKDYLPDDYYVRRVDFGKNTVTVEHETYR
jgi:hypothetical protein